MLGSLLGEFNGFFIKKQIEKFECALFCFKALRKRLEHSRSENFFRALAAPCVIYNRAQSRFLCLLNKSESQTWTTLTERA